MRVDLSELREQVRKGSSNCAALLGRRRDLITEQNRTITRLREALVSLFLQLWR